MSSRTFNNCSAANGGIVRGNLDMKCKDILNVQNLVMCSSGNIIGDTIGVFGNLDVSGNVQVLGFTQLQDVSINNLDISGNLSLNCNLLNDVSGINFCDGTYIGHGSSFDISANDVLVLSGVQDVCGNYNGASIVSKNRVYQQLNQDASWNAVSGYLGLAKDAYPALNPYSSGEKAVSLWYQRLSATINIWSSVAWSPELQLFAAVSTNGNGTQVMTSSDGIVWTTRSTPTIPNSSQQWRSICWSSELSIFVAVASSGTHRVMTSSDGLMWNIQTSVTNANNWRSVCWSAELGIFVAVAGSDNNRVMISNNGESWESHFIEEQDWRSVCWSAELGIFVAVANSGEGKRVATSQNGKVWTLQNSAADNNWNSVAWSPELGIFVAVSGTGGVGQPSVMTSTDGKNWILQPPVINNDWRSVCWCPELGLFVAVSISGDGNRVMTSLDGILWNIQETPVNHNWISLCWSSELGIVVSVALGGVSGNNNRVMTSSLLGRPPTSYNVFDSRFNNIDQNGNWTIKAKEIYSDNLIVNSNVDITGNLTVRGTTTQVSTQQLFIKDNVIEINQTMDASGNIDPSGVLPNPTDFQSGFVVYRGPDPLALDPSAVRTPYQFMYDESSNTFQIGISGEMQPVATREDIPTDNGVAVWDVSTNRFVTDRGVFIDPSGNLGISGDLNMNCNEIKTVEVITFCDGVRIGNDAGKINQNASSIAIGNRAGEENQQLGTIAIGFRAGRASQQQKAIAIGEYAGDGGQQQNGIAIGERAGGNSQQVASIALGNYAGGVSQQGAAIAIGARTGETNQGAYSIAIGASAGRNQQQQNSIAIGRNSGLYTQGSNSVAIGSGTDVSGGTGGWFQQTGGIAIGWNAGQYTQGSNSVAIGVESGKTNQGGSAVAIGNNSGQFSQGVNGIAIGNNAGQTSQKSGAIAIGLEAGSNNQEISAIAIGDQAGKNNQKNGAIAIGFGSGINNQQNIAISIGYQSGLASQQNSAIAIGYRSGVNSQGVEAIAIGSLAGESNQQSQNIAIGYSSGRNSQQRYGTAIGYGAGQNNQGQRAISLGTLAGVDNQKQGAIAIGDLVGRYEQGVKAIAIGCGETTDNSGSTGGWYQQTGAIALGYRAGQFTQGTNSVAIGVNAGQTSQAPNSVAIGINAGSISQLNNAVSIGVGSGQFNQQASTVAIGALAGHINQGANSVAIGNLAGSTGQLSNSVCIGPNAGRENQQGNAVAIGVSAGRIFQSGNCVAIGNSAGLTGQQGNAVAIGVVAGNQNQGLGSVAVGSFAGNDGQKNNAVAIGNAAGRTFQGASTVAIGWQSGETNQNDGAIAIGKDSGRQSQRNNAVAIGNEAGNSTQGNFAIAIGFQSASKSQGANSIAIGNNAGNDNQGTNSIAIGRNAGFLNQHNNSIIISALDVSLNSDASNAFYVAPVRNKGGSNLLQYDISNNEISYSNTINGDIEISGNLDLSCNLINDVSGIYFCDGTYIGHGSSFDISTNEVLKIYSNNGISQVLNTNGDTLLLNGEIPNNLTERLEKLQIHSVSSVNSSAGFYCYDSNRNNSSRLEFYKNESGNINSNGDVSLNSVLGFIGFQGRVGSAYLRGASIRGITEDINAATGLSFLTKPPTSTILTERLRINNIGNIGIGTIPLAPYRLDVRNLQTNDTRVMINDCSQCITTSNAMLNLFIRENQTKEHIHFRRAFTTPSGIQIKDFGMAVDDDGSLTMGKYDNNGNYEELLYVNENHTIEVDGTQGGDFVIKGSPDITLKNVSNNKYDKTGGLINGNVKINGNLDMSCNVLTDVSGIYFCDGTFIGNGNSFDFNSNRDIKIYTNSGISQIVNQSGDTILLNGEEPTTFISNNEKLQIHLVSSTNSSAGLYTYDNDLSNSSQLEFYKNESANINNLSNTSVGSSLGIIGFNGVLNNNYTRGASIRSSVEGDNLQTNLRFFTKEDTTIESEKIRITSFGNILHFQPEPTTTTGSLLIYLTPQQLQSRIIIAQSSVDYLLPTGISMEEICDVLNLAIDWNIIPTVGGSFNIQINTNHSIIGSRTISPSRSAGFRSHRTGQNIWTTYRLY